MGKRPAAGILGKCICHPMEQPCHVGANYPLLIVTILVAHQIHKIPVNKKERKKETAFFPSRWEEVLTVTTGISVDLSIGLKSRWMRSDSVMLSLYKIRSKQFWRHPRKTVQLNGRLP